MFRARRIPRTAQSPRAGGEKKTRGMRWKMLSEKPARTIISAARRTSSERPRVRSQDSPGLRASTVRVLGRASAARLAACPRRAFRGQAGETPRRRPIGSQRRAARPDNQQCRAVRRWRRFPLSAPLCSGMPPEGRENLSGRVKPSLVDPRAPSARGPPRRFGRQVLRPERKRPALQGPDGIYKTAAAVTAPQDAVAARQLLQA